MKWHLKKLKAIELVKSPSSFDPYIANMFKSYIKNKKKFHHFSVSETIDKRMIDLVLNLSERYKKAEIKGKHVSEMNYYHQHIQNITKYTTINIRQPRW